jgi:hypothetical protein
MMYRQKPWYIIMSEQDQDELLRALHRVANMLESAGLLDEARLIDKIVLHVAPDTPDEASIVDPAEYLATPSGWKISAPDGYEDIAMTREVADERAENHLQSTGVAAEVVELFERVARTEEDPVGIIGWLLERPGTPDMLLRKSPDDRTRHHYAARPDCKLTPLYAIGPRETLERVTRRALFFIGMVERYLFHRDGEDRVSGHTLTDVLYEFRALLRDTSLPEEMTRHVRGLSGLKGSDFVAWGPRQTRWREGFERWLRSLQARKALGRTFELELDYDGNYAEEEVHIMWQAWKHCCNAQTAGIAPENKDMLAGLSTLRRVAGHLRGAVNASADVADAAKNSLKAADEFLESYSNISGNRLPPSAA